MGMGEAVGLFFKRYTDFQGRSRRAEYWWFFLATFIVVIPITVILMTAGGLNVDSTGGIDLNPLGWGIAAIAGIAYIAIIIPSIALGVRRFHDLGQTGWLFLVFVILNFIPVVGTIASIGQLIWFAMPGTKGPNKYGPDPKGGHDVDVFS